LDRIVTKSSDLRRDSNAGIQHDSAMFEELRFRVATDICQLWPVGPEREERLALLDQVIANGMRARHTVLLAKRGVIEIWKETDQADR
jgi:hypothetical protein